MPTTRSTRAQQICGNSQIISGKVWQKFVGRIFRNNWRFTLTFCKLKNKGIYDDWSHIISEIYMKSQQTESTLKHLQYTRVRWTSGKRLILADNPHCDFKPDVATDLECRSRLRQDSAFFFWIRCQAKFLTSAKFLTYCQGRCQKKICEGAQGLKWGDTGYDQQVLPFHIKIVLFITDFSFFTGNLRLLLKIVESESCERSVCLKKTNRTETEKERFTTLSFDF